jgi:hypothetical protein
MARSLRVLLVAASATAAYTEDAAQPKCDAYEIAHAASSGRQFDTAAPLAAAGGLGGGDLATLSAACMDLCDPLPECAGVVAELAHFGGSCWAISSAAVTGGSVPSGRNASSWLRRRAEGDTEANATPTWWLAPPTVHVFQDALPTAMRFCRAVRQPTIALAAARGELESFQLVLRSPTAPRQVSVSLTQFDSPGLQLSWRRVGYVRRVLNESEIPNWPHPTDLPAGGCENMSKLSGGCALYPSERGADAWFPDMLLDESREPSIPLPAGLSQPLFITTEVGETAVAGNHTASVRVHDAESGEVIAEVSIVLTVWNISLTAELRAFPEAAEFAEGYLDRYYPENISVRVDPAVALLPDAQAAYDREMCDHRMPPNTWTAARDGDGLKMLVDPAQCNEK